MNFDLISSQAAVVFEGGGLVGDGHVVVVNDALVNVVVVVKVGQVAVADISDSMVSQSPLENFSVDTDALDDESGRVVVGRLLVIEHLMDVNA